MSFKRNYLSLAIGTLLSVGMVGGVHAQAHGSADGHTAAMAQMHEQHSGDDAVATARMHEQQSEGQPTQTLDTVMVTGSHIERAQMSGISAVKVIDAEAIALSGALTVDDLLQRMPFSAGYAGSQSSAYWNSNGWGTTQVNLRGLGVNRTLVLLNGRRVVSGGTGANTAVDLNMIPVAIIERIEILKDGASAIYGADAVAGVVNIITKKRFNGMEASVRYGQTFRDDGEGTQADLIWGKTGDMGSIVAGISYSESGIVNMADREDCALREKNGELVCFGSSATIGGRALLADGTRVNFNQDPNGNGDFYENYSPAKHNFASFPYLNAVNPAKRFSIFTYGRVNWSDSVSSFFEFLYNHRETSQIATPGAIGGRRPLHIAASNPFNPTGQDLILESRRLLEAGPREFSQEVDTTRFVLGLNGELDSGWNWSMAFNFGRNTATDSATNIANLKRVRMTIDQSICSESPDAAIPCVDYLGYGDITQAELEYILFSKRDTGGNQQEQFTANLTGELFQLPAGWVSMATGVEIRRDSGWLYPDSLTVAGIADTNQQSPVSGEIRATAAYVEFAVPLLFAQPFAENVMLDLAGRFSSYETFGSDFNYKIGLGWKLTQGIKLRANYSTAFRAPNVRELFGGISEGHLPTADPCSNWSSLPSSSVVYQNCKSAGVPADYVQLSKNILTTMGGNRSLEPEQAKTMSVGAVFSSDSLAGLTLTLDYFNIKIDNAIQSIPGSTKLAMCYNTPGLKHPFCSEDNFVRNPRTGEITYLSAQMVNAASEEVAGVDLGLLQNFDVAGWNASLNMNVSYLDYYNVQPFPGAEIIHYAGKVGGGRGSYAEWRAFASLSASNGPWTGAWTVQYIGEADDVSAKPGDIGAHAPSIAYHNLRLAYRFDDTLRLSAGVNNLLDKEPPFIKSWTDANTDTMTYDLLGRRWFLKATYRW